MGKLLRDSDLSYMREYAARMLPDTCVVLEEIRTANAAGKWTSAWTPVSGGTVACRMDIMRGRMIQMPAPAGREAIINQFLLSVAYDSPALAVNRQVRHGGYTYEIQQLFDDHSDRVVKQALVVRLD